MAHTSTHIITILFGLGLFSTNILFAQVWQDYPQPIGILAQLWNIAGALPFPVQPPPPNHSFPLPTTPMGELNYICAQWDKNMTTETVPFDINFPATQIISTSPQHFVRLYAPGIAPNTGSGPNGAWFMRSQYVRGLTPEQLQDRFALPAAPTMIINVEFPASPAPSGKDYAIFTGIAGPIEGWGKGGGLQNRIVANFNGTNYFPNYAFTTGVRDHPQPLGAIALAYTPMAGSGNTGHVAAYLDKFIPEAYSDMENVYTDLDYLNWINFGPEPLRKALKQISPEKYGALSFVLTRNALLIANAFLDFRYLSTLCPLQFKNNCDKCECLEPQFSLQFIGEEGKENKGHSSGFNYYTKGAIGNFDLQLSKELMIGIDLAYLDNNIHFRHRETEAHLQTIEGGVFVSYDFSYYFFDALLNGGYNWSKVHRSIKFYGVDRKAHSQPCGWDLDAHLQFGINRWICNWLVSPLIRASYFCISENHFHEKRADSLNLSIHSFNAHTIRTVLETGLSRIFMLGYINLVPQIQLGWAHDFLLDRRKIRSSLIALGGAFSVQNYNRDRNSLLGACQLIANINKNISFTGSYDVEIEKYFFSQTAKLSINLNF